MNNEVRLQPVNALKLSNPDHGCVRHLNQGKILCGILALWFVFAPAGCTTQSKAKQQARKAYIAGQQQAQQRLQAQTSVTVLGPVRNQLVPWTDDLTLAKALVIADYSGKGAPREIILVRNGLAQHIDPQQLLAGNDVPLLAGDLIQLR